MHVLRNSTDVIRHLRTFFYFILYVVVEASCTTLPTISRCVGKPCGSFFYLIAVPAALAHTWKGLIETRNEFFNVSL